MGLLSFLTKCRRLRRHRVSLIDLSNSLISFYNLLDRLPLYEERGILPLAEGISYIFNGHIDITCERFSIDFLYTDMGDTALHINPRLPQSYIVRNSKIHDAWGKEESASLMPCTLHRGGKFSIQVLVTNECYMIAVNGTHFVEFVHRLPFRLVDTVQVKGDVSKLTVQRYQLKEYPEGMTQNRPIAVQLEVGTRASVSYKHVHPDTDNNEDGLHVPNAFLIVRLQTGSAGGYLLPYYGRLPDRSLYAGRCVKIEGRIKLLPHSFQVKLQQGRDIWPHPLVAFDFNPIFAKQAGNIGKAIVTRKSWYNDGWSHEQVSMLDTDMRPGKVFSLVIVCADDAFEVYVNRKFLLEFKYELQPDIVDMVYIHGDMKLWRVVVENNRLRADSTELLVYQNPAKIPKPDTLEEEIFIPPCL